VQAFGDQVVQLLLMAQLIQPGLHGVQVDPVPRQQLIEIGKARFVDGEQLPRFIAPAAARELRNLEFQALPR
jgi:hypothetical protein